MHDPQADIQTAMAALLALRETLGDESLALALAPLQARLNALQPDAGSARRCHATVLFADVVGSTELGGKLDPEDLSAVVDGTLAELTAIVQRHRGVVLQYAGDNLLAVFGLPPTREDDAERAVLAGLDMLEAVRRRAADVAGRHGHSGFGVRVGLHTGDVLVGGGVDGNNSVRGATVNLAARMEQTAPAGGLRISQDTYRHVRGRFRLAPQPPLQVKGAEAPLRTYLVLGPAPQVDPSASRGVEGIATPLVGRDDVMGRLEAVATALRSSPAPALAMVTIVGEAGLGKSRLVAEFRRRQGLRPGAPGWLQAHAAEQHMRRPYFLLRCLIASAAGAAGLAGGETAAQASERWMLTVAPAFSRPADAAVLGHFLGLEFADEPELQALRGEARQLRDRAFFHAVQLFGRWVEQQGPLVLWLDDLHWADDGTLDFLEHLQRRAPGLALMVIGTTRSTFLERRPAWGTDALGIHAHRIDLSPLDTQAAGTLADRLLARLAPAPPELRALLVERSEGNPFFMEELLNMLLDQDIVVAGDAAWSCDPGRLRALALPGTLVGVLRARLDALDDDERRTAQLAAVVGYRFWDDSLRALGAPTSGALARLIARELVLPPAPGDPAQPAAYCFKHHTLHQVVYDSLLRRERPALHARVAHWLMAQPGTPAYDLVADHAERGGDRTLAAQGWQQAADLAARGYANAQALEHAQRALALIGPDEPDRRYALTLLRCRVLEVMSDRDRLAGELDALAALAEATADPVRQAEVLCRRARNVYDRGDAAQALALAERALQVAPQWEVEARGLLARCLIRLGRRAEGESACRLALARAQATADVANEGRLLNDLGMVALERGDFAAAQTLYQQALERHRALGHRANEGGTLNNLGYVALTLGDYADAQTIFVQARDLFARIGHRQNEGIALINLAMARLGLQCPDTAEADARGALSLLQAAGDRWAQGAAWRVIGQAALDRGDCDGAAQAFGTARQLFADLQLHHLGLEAVAGLAATALARGDLVAAVAAVDEVLACRAAGVSLDGTEEPARVQAVGVAVLEAAGDPRAGALLQEAVDDLQRRAERIGDARWRDAFLTAVPFHRALLTAWERRQPPVAATGSRSEDR